MVIAEFDLPEWQIPEDVLANASTPVIDTFPAWLTEGVWDSSDWISCCYAFPHRDPDWKDEVFLTLSVVSEHQAGDALTADTLIAVPRGVLFVVDPLVAHWLAPKTCGQTKDAPPWVGLQWEVPRTEAMQRARDLVQRRGGRWLPTTDTRYAHWDQQPSAPHGACHGQQG